MKSIVKVVTPAPSYDLSVLATLKSELGITDTTSDLKLQAMLTNASFTVAEITGRVWAQETVQEKFYFGFWECITSLVLSRRPVASDGSGSPPTGIRVVENGVTLVEDADFALDARRGMLYRINYGGFLNGVVGAPSVVVDYTGGYVLLDDLPYGLERATLILAKAYWHSSSRDPGVRSETTYELDSVTYRDVADAEKQVRDLLSVYSEPSFA